MSGTSGPEPTRVASLPSLLAERPKIIHADLKIDGWPWQVQFRPAPLKMLSRLSRLDRERIRAAIDRLPEGAPP